MGLGVFLCNDDWFESRDDKIYVYELFKTTSRSRDTGKVTALRNSRRKLAIWPKSSQIRDYRGVPCGGDEEESDEESDEEESDEEEID